MSACLPTPKPIRRPSRSRAWLLAIALTVLSLARPAAAQRALTLDEAIRTAREKNPSLAVARAEQEQASAATVTARQYANPSFSGLGGRFDARDDMVNEGATFRLLLSQPLESPFVRKARAETAEAGLASAAASAIGVDRELVARVKRAFSDVLLADRQLELLQEQLDLLGRVRAGIQKSVEVGEGPGLDLARAETEVLNSRRELARARVVVLESKLALGNALGESGTGDLEVEGPFPALALPERLELQERLIRDNPRLVQARREIERAEGKLSLERHRRLDGFQVDATWEREPDNDIFALGLRIPLPLWNLRRGEIAEASAGVKRARALVAAQELALRRDLDALYNRHRVALEQVELIEQGLLQEAGRALRGAETAYRSGERGILEYLDAQRTLRDIRFDLLKARGEIQRTGIEIERLAGTTR